MADAFDGNRLEQLCRLAKADDANAERELFSHLTDSFRIFAQHKFRDRAEAEEVAQDALAVVAQKYKETSFVSSFAGWAHNILRNTISSHIRQKASRARLRPQAEVAMAGLVQGQVSEDIRRKILACLRDVARSNRRFARAINLHYQGFTATEIGDRLGITREYFYVVLARGRAMLEACLGIAED